MMPSGNAGLMTRMIQVSRPTSRPKIQRPVSVSGAVTGPAGRVSLATSTRYLPAAEVSLFVPVETVAAITWAWLAFEEVPSGPTVVGGLVVLAAVFHGTRPSGNLATVS